MNKTQHSRRASLLIVAMLFSAIIAVSLTSYLNLATTALKYSTRGFLENQSMNLTESGLELALNSLNNSSWPAPWTISGTNAYADFTGFSYGGNVTGFVRVYVTNYASNGNATVIAQGVLSPATGATVVKMVQLTGVVKRSLFSKGLVGRNGVNFSGNNSSVDSWNSLYNSDGTARASAVPYSSSVANDAGSIAALSVTATDSVWNANVWGTASVGGNSTNLVSVGPQGLVGPYGTPAGTKDANSITTNFTDNLTSVSAPTYSAINTISSDISGNTTLPRTGDTVASDGKYYYSVPSIEGGTLTITGNVVIIPTASVGSTAISLSGSDGIVINSGASLNIYTPADVKIAGNGVINNNATSLTSSFGIWGTGNVTNPASSTQTITISGNGVLEGTIYAPNATISAKGGGNSGAIYGAFVGYKVNMTGNDSFHYDEALGLAPNTDTYTPSKWRELTTATDRAVYATPDWTRGTTGSKILDF